ncbi:MAG TPA: YceI family protein [Vicinamibacterales bacterium]|nr:YceI family protein [Vicinamibacterales bacterium]
MTLAAAVFAAMTPPTARGADVDDLVVAPQSGRVDFTIFAKMLFTVKKQGQFKDFAGEISYDPAHPSDTHVELTVFTTSVSMKDPDHAQLLKSGEFFDVEHYPTMRFVSAGTAIHPDGSLALTGDLTIRNVTKRIDVPITVINGTFETTFEIDRTEFGLNGSPTWGGFNVSIARHVEIHIAVGLAQRPRPTP